MTGMVAPKTPMKVATDAETPTTCSPSSSFDLGDPSCAGIADSSPRAEAESAKAKAEKEAAEVLARVRELEAQLADVSQQLEKAGTRPLPNQFGGGYLTLPSQGSASHSEGRCKPCAFLYEGCANGIDCQFCHLCPPGELKRRKRMKLAARRRMCYKEASSRTWNTSNVTLSCAAPIAAAGPQAMVAHFSEWAASPDAGLCR
jgi:hypothetical protein